MSLCPAETTPGRCVGARLSHRQDFRVELVRRLPCSLAVHAVWAVGRDKYLKHAQQRVDYPRNLYYVTSITVNHIGTEPR